MILALLFRSRPKPPAASDHNYGLTPAGQAERVFHQARQVLEEAQRRAELDRLHAELDQLLGSMYGWYFDADQRQKRDRARQLAARIRELAR